LDCYPSPGDYIDNLILYKASTGTYYQLTEESYNIFINSVEPIGGTNGHVGTTIMEVDLYFEPLEGTTILQGDMNQDGLLNVIDVVVIVNMIITEIPGEQIAQQYPQADMNGDGTVNVLDVVTLAQLILNNPTTSQRDRQELQRQLDRLSDDTTQSSGIGRTKPKPTRKQLESMSDEQLSNLASQIRTKPKPIKSKQPVQLPSQIIPPLVTTMPSTDFSMSECTENCWGICTQEIDMELWQADMPGNPCNPVPGGLGYSANCLPYLVTTCTFTTEEGYWLGNIGCDPYDVWGGNACCMDYGYCSTEDDGNVDLITGNEYSYCGYLSPISGTAAYNYNPNANPISICENISGLGSAGLQEINDCIEWVNTHLNSCAYDLVEGEVNTSPVSVLQINAGHLPPIDFNNISNTVDDYDGCNPDCTDLGLCRRDHEDEIRTKINELSPDIVVITELISNNTCLTKPACNEVSSNINSSCYQDGTEQIDRLLPSGYQIVCNDNEDPYYDGYTCTGIKTGINRNIVSSSTLPATAECTGLGWPNVNEINLETMTIVPAHLYNGMNIIEDECRSSQLQQIFDMGVPLLAIGDFNFDPYTQDWYKLLTPNESESLTYIGEWITGLLNNDYELPQIIAEHSANWSGDLGSITVGWVVKVWDIDVNINNIDLNVINQNTLQAADLNMTINLNNTTFKFCADDDVGWGWYAAAGLPNNSLSIPTAQGCDSHITGEFSGNISLTVRFQEDNTMGVMNTNTDVSNLNFDILNWPSWAQPSILEDEIQQKVKEFINGGSIATIIQSALPGGYDTLTSNNLLTHTDSTTYWFNSVEPNFTVHNNPNLITFDYLMLQGTLDYIVSNIWNNSNCETYTFDFMDHHMLYCELSM
jgi:hypothetical protein